MGKMGAGKFLEESGLERITNIKSRNRGNMMKTNKLGMAISLVVMVSAASLTANLIHVAPAAAGGDDANNGLS